MNHPSGLALLKELAMEWASEGAPEAAEGRAENAIKNDDPGTPLYRSPSGNNGKTGNKWRPRAIRPLPVRGSGRSEVVTGEGKTVTSEAPYRGITTETDLTAALAQRAAARMAAVDLETTG